MPSNDSLFVRKSLSSKAILDFMRLVMAFSVIEFFVYAINVDFELTFSF